MDFILFLPLCGINSQHPSFQAVPKSILVAFKLYHKGGKSRLFGPRHRQQIAMRIGEGSEATGRGSFSVIHGIFPLPASVSYKIGSMFENVEESWLLGAECRSTPSS
jgi:hypothetical protein